MNKPLIIAVLALGAACACTKSEPVLETESNEISFQVASYLSQTKANVAFTGTEFGVYSWFDAETAAEKDQVMMSNQKVTKSSSDWKPTGKTYYWPKTGDVDFFAYAPYADPSATPAQTPWVSIARTSGKNSLSATDLTIAGTEDYMYSSMAMNYNKNVDPATYKTISGVSAGVPILFHHALAKLTVMFNATKVSEGTDNVWDIKVNTAEFVKVCTKGSLAMEMAASPVNGTVEWVLPTNNIWAPSSAAADNISLQAVAAAGQTLTTALTAGLLNDYTVLPQALAGMDFHINFTIKASNDGGTTWYSTETIDRTFNVIDREVSGVTVNGAFRDAGNYWKMNSKITYNVTISPSAREILFDPAVENWETVPSSGSSSLTF